MAPYPPYLARNYGPEVVYLYDRRHKKPALLIFVCERPARPEQVVIVDVVLEIVPVRGSSYECFFCKCPNIQSRRGTRQTLMAVDVMFG